MKNAPGPYTTEPSLLLFRRRLAALMRVTGIGQDELAEMIGQSSRSIGLWLTGVRLPSAVSLKALSRTFGVPADWLLGADAVEIASGLTRLAEIVSAPKTTDEGANKVPDLGNGQSWVTALSLGARSCKHRLRMDELWQDCRDMAPR